MAFTFALSSMQVEPPDVARFPFADKVVHFFEYALLGFLSARAAGRTWPGRAPLRVAAVGVLIATAWGLSDELHQAFVPGRTADVWDLVADFFGACAGAVGALWLRRRDDARAAPPVPVRRPSV